MATVARPGRRNRSWWGVLAALLLLLSGLDATGALACSVCYSAGESQRGAYYLVTVFLTLLPLVMLGVLGGLLHRASQGAADRAPGVPRG